MSIFRQLMTDRVTLVKADGRRFENMPASVQKGAIHTDDPKIPIEDGDVFERALPSGLVERYTVTDAGFFAGMHGMPAHYQSSVRKSVGEALLDQPRHVVYNLNGPNARVNIQSADSSTNVVGIDPEALFEKLREAVERSVANAALKQRLVEGIGEMKSEAGKPGFGERYARFVGLAADHMSVIAPFLPALTQLVAG